jgi:endonuclease YncB( thermonuclease family)
MPVEAGDITVRDGDTIVVDGTPVRLQGVAAPELGEPGGHHAKVAMQQLVRDGVTCELTGERTWDREVGVCYDSPGQDIGAAIIAAGLARDCARYSGGRYASVETAESRRLPLPGYCR